MINSIVDIYNLIKNDTYLRTVLDIENADLNEEQGYIKDCAVKDNSNMLNFISFYFNSQESCVDIEVDYVDAHIPREIVDKDIIDTKLFIEVIDFIFKYAKSDKVNISSTRDGSLTAFLPRDTIIYKNKDLNKFRLSFQGFSWFSLTCYPDKDYCIVNVGTGTWTLRFYLSEKTRDEPIFLEMLKKEILNYWESKTYFKTYFKKYYDFSRRIKEILNKFLDATEDE